MEQLIKWVQQYSPPAVVALAFSAALMFALRLIVERAVSTEFDKKLKRIELRLERRSHFEEMVLLEQYKTVAGLHMKIMRTLTYLYRNQKGLEVEGLFLKTDERSEIIPVTEVLQELAAKRYLLPAGFHDLLLQYTDHLRKYAYADFEELPKIEEECLWPLNEEFRSLMNDHFGIDKISWQVKSDCGD